MNLTLPDSQKIVVMNQLIHNAQNVKSTTTQFKFVYSVYELEIKQITLFVKCVKLISVKYTEIMNPCNILHSIYR